MKSLHEKVKEKVFFLFRKYVKSFLLILFANVMRIYGLIVEENQARAINRKELLVVRGIKYTLAVAALVLVCFLPEIYGDPFYAGNQSILSFLAEHSISALFAVFILGMIFRHRMLGAKASTIAAYVVISGVAASFTFTDRGASYSFSSAVWIFSILFLLVYASLIAVFHKQKLVSDISEGSIFVGSLGFFLVSFFMFREQSLLVLASVFYLATAASLVFTSKVPSGETRALLSIFHGLLIAGLSVLQMISVHASAISYESFGSVEYLQLVLLLFVAGSSFFYVFVQSFEILSGLSFLKRKVANESIKKRLSRSYLMHKKKFVLKQSNPIVMISFLLVSGVMIFISSKYTHYEIVHSVVLLFLLYEFIPEKVRYTNRKVKKIMYRSIFENSSRKSAFLISALALGLFAVSAIFEKYIASGILFVFILYDVVPIFLSWFFDCMLRLGRRLKKKTAA